MFLKDVIGKWKILLGNREFSVSLLFSVACMIISYMFYDFVIVYVESFKNLPVLGDLFHGMLPVVDLRYIYIYGLMVAVAALFFYFLIWRPQLFPFYLKVFAFVYITRSCFITLTHFGPPQGFLLPQVAMDINGWPFSDLLHTNDLFFSGHVAYPFMAALLVRKENRILYYVFLAVSVLMAVTVLMMRVHYSIDVFAAYFIVFGVYSATMHLFGKKDMAFGKLLS
jgi:hypothetical protein